MKIIVEGSPLSKARHRTCVKNTHVFIYDPQSKEKEIMKKYLLANAISQDWLPLREGPLKVDLIFELDAFCGATKPEYNNRLWEYSLPCKKPDIDNLVKFILDCGNGILWPDDRFIIKLCAIKKYSKKPCTIIDVNHITGIKMSKEQENVFKTFSPTDLFDFIKSANELCIRHSAFHQDHLLTLAPDELAAAAHSLVNFANTWSDKLRKIKAKNE